MTILYGGFVDLSLEKGDAVHALELTGELRKLGSRVILVAHSGKPGAVDDFFSTGGYEGGKGLLSRFVLFGLSFLRAGERILYLSSACDVLYMRDYLFCAIALLAKMLHSKRMVWEVNGIAGLERAHKAHPFNFLFIPLISLLERLAGMSADRIVPVSRGITEVLLRRGCISSKISLVENGVNVDMFAAKFSASVIQNERKRLGIPISVPVICYVGAIRPWQGLELLITAAREMMGKSRDTRFLVVGGGEGLDSLKEQAESEGVDSLFVFTGPIPYERVPLMIALSDVCVAPFAGGRVASPMKVYEYMAAGKPMVVSRIRGLEFIEERGLGRLVDPDDADDLAEVLTCLLTDWPAAEAMAARAQEYARRNCSWLSVARRIKGLCEELVDD
jgi:glycosyltransferase involved in cell wall biosynthesis